tara:strand:+ start:1625 stop:2086 length:462 start_codon:yes stop_codon:yes gene_type:complete
MAFDIENYTAEELANLASDPTTLTDLLKDLDVGSKKRTFFAKFDPTEISDIIASFEGKMKSLDQGTKAKIQGLKGEMKKVGQASRFAMGKSGLSGGAMNPLKFQSNLFSQVGDVSKQRTLGMQQMGVDMEQEKKSAYKQYEDQFMQMLGAIKG